MTSKGSKMIPIWTNKWNKMIPWRVYKGSTINVIYQYSYVNQICSKYNVVIHDMCIVRVDTIPNL